MSGEATGAQAGFGPRRLGHANLYVSNLARSIEFYNKVCGFEKVGLELGTDAGFVSNGNTHHDFGLVETTGKPFRGRNGETLAEARMQQPGLNHFGWELDNEAQLVAAIERATAAGVHKRLTVDHTVSHSIYIFDPDSIVHEFYADVMADWRTVFRGGEIENISAHWTPGASQPLSQPLWETEPEIRVVAEAPLHPLRTTRAAVVVSNMDRLLGFYVDIAGLEAAFVAPDRSYAVLRGQASTADFHLALFAQAPGLEVGCHHVGCAVADEGSIEQAKAALDAAGIKVDRLVDNAAKRALLLRDPDGLLIEFYCPREPDFVALAEAPPAERPFLA